MGKTVVIKNDVLEVYASSFLFQKIDNLVIEDGVEILGFCAFARNNIRKLYLPKSIKAIKNGCFDKNPITELIVHNTNIQIGNYNFINVEKITIIDGNYDSVVNLIIKINGYNSNFSNVRQINVVNSNLSFIEKMKIKFFIRHYDNIFVNFSQKIDLDEFLKPNFKSDELCKNANDVYEEVESLLNKIESLIESLDNDTKKLIENKLIELVNEYQSKISNIEPAYNSDNVLKLEFEENSFSSLRIKLIISLESIILNLNPKILNFSKKLNQYQKYLKENVNIDLDDNLNTIKIIVDLANNLNKPVYKDKINDLLEEMKKIISDNLTFSNLINLTLENIDIENLFKKKLNDIFVEIKFLNDKLLPYLKLLYALKGEQNELELSKQIIMLNENFETNDNFSLSSLIEQYQKLKEKYIKLINNCILNINDKNLIKPNDIELKFRKELHPLLEELPIKLPIILKNKKTSKIISETVEFIEGNKEKNNYLIDFVKTIDNLMNVNSVPFLTKSKIISDIKVILNKWQIILNTQEASEIIKNFNNEIGLKSIDLIIEIMILEDLFEVQINLEKYINDLRLYNLSKSNLLNISFEEEFVECSSKDLVYINRSPK